jgi:hypothetical protein
VSLYYDPEDFGLTVVGEVEWSEPSYSFNRTVIWRDNYGQLYWASDSGCSCPSPFEWVDSLDQLERGGQFDAIVALQERLDQEEEDDNQFAAGTVVDVIGKVLAVEFVIEEEGSPWQELFAGE